MLTGNLFLQQLKLHGAQVHLRVNGFVIRNLAGDSGIIELVGSIVMTDELWEGLLHPVVMSDAVSIKVVEPNLVSSPKAAINQTFNDMLDTVRQNRR